MTKVEADFIELIEEYKYEEAAKMYFDRAYQYRNEFNIILNERNVKGKVMDIMGKLEEYGEYSDQRLTGLHETASINDFSYGVSDRGASIRIPIITVEQGWKGWLEDRRPASNADPYKIAGRIVKTVKTAKVHSVNI